MSEQGKNVVRDGVGEVRNLGRGARAGSVGNIMEEILAGDKTKREREENMGRSEGGGEVESFKRSKRVLRSPDRKEGEADEIVRRVGDMIKELLKKELRQECGRIGSKMDG